jgi:hypothetical protein
MDKFSKSSDALPPSVRENPPPIPFVFKVNKMDMVEGTDADKDKIDQVGASYGCR